MPFYRCLIRGENFAWKTDSGWELMGFYTTRWVQASHAPAAEQHVVTRLREEPEFQRPDGYVGGPPTKVFIEEIAKVRSLPLRRGSGATWFVMDEQFT
jgi:hypothetical protein